MVTVGELLPKFCTELQDLISAAGRADLVDQVRTLPIVGRCTCGEFNCAHFYTAEPPTKSYGAGHSNLILSADVGFMAVDLLHNRPEVKAQLDGALPLSRNAPAAPCLACPACGFLTVPETSYGTYSICELCGWEDDGVQLANPACGGGANRESLVEAQRAALARVPLGVAESAGICRSLSWRPLTAFEVARATAERDQRYWMNPAVVEVSE